MGEFSSTQHALHSLRIVVESQSEGVDHLSRGFSGYLGRTLSLVIV